MAKRTFTLTAKETEILIYTLLGEAEGEGADGMRAVASVIVNRSLTEKNSGDFPDDPIAVVSETRPGGGFQFDGGPGTSRYEEMKAKYGPGSPEYAQAARVVASHIAAPNPPDATGIGAVFFDTNGTWQSAWAGKQTKKIGNHFYYETKGLKPKGDVTSTPASAMIDAASNAALAGIDAAFPAGTVTAGVTTVNRVLETQAQVARVRKGSLSPELFNVLNTVGEKLDVYFEVTSGGQKARSPFTKADVDYVAGSSTRHDDGTAADTMAYTLNEDGSKRYLDFSDPADRAKWAQIAQYAVAAGATGIGAATNYMGNYKMHIGFGEPAVWGKKGEAAPDWLVDAYATGLAMPPITALGYAPTPLDRKARPDSLAQQVTDTRAEAIAEAREGARQMVQAQVAAKMGAGNNAFTPRIEYLDGSYWIDGVPMPIAYDGTFAPFDPNIGAAVDSMSRDADTVSPYGAITFREPVGDWMSMNQLFDDTGQPSSAPAPKLTRADIIDPLGRPRPGQELTGVARTQASLKAAGFDPGPVDGKMGPQTKAAIRAFQKASGLKVDGIVGPKTSAGLDAIGGASPAIRDPLGVGVAGMSSTPTLNLSIPFEEPADARFAEFQKSPLRDSVSGRPAYDAGTGLFMLPEMDVPTVFDPTMAGRVDDGGGGRFRPAYDRGAARTEAFTAIDMATAMQVVLAPVAGVRVPQGTTMDPIGAGASFRGVEAMKRSVAGMTAAQLQAIVASIPANAPPVPLPRKARPAPGKIDNSANASSYPPFVGSGQPSAGGGVAYPPSKLTNDASQPAAPVAQPEAPRTITRNPGAYGPQFAVIDVNGQPIKDGTKVQIGSTVKTRSGDRVAVLNVRTGLAMLVQPAQVAKKLNQQKRDAIFDFAKNNLGLDDKAAWALSEIDEQTDLGRLAREGGDVLGIRVPGARDMIGSAYGSGSAAIKMGITSLIGSGFAFARSVVPAAAKAAVGAVVGSAGKIPLPSMATVKPGAVSKPAQQRATVIRQRTEDVSLPPAAAPKPPATQPVTQPAAGPSWGSVPPVYKITPAKYTTVWTAERPAVPPPGMVAQGQYSVTPAERAAFNGSQYVPPPAAPAVQPKMAPTRVLVSEEIRTRVYPGGGLAPRAAPSRPTPPPTVQIKTGKAVAVGTTYQQGKSGSGKPYTYRVEADGSIKNLTTGRTTSSATTKTTTSTAGLKPGDRVYNADTNEWNIKR